MTLTLHLGVIEQPYSDASYDKPRSAKALLGAAKRGKISAPAPQTNGRTTGDIAEILEEKYHIMEIFSELHEDLIVQAVADGMEGAIQNIAAGQPGVISLTSEAESEIEMRFRQFLSNREMDGTATSGVPTKAGRDGVSHRFLHPYAKRGSRPSFIDTGLYQANFKAWTDE